MARSIALAMLQRGLVKKHNDDNLLLLNAWVPPGERADFSRSVVTEVPFQFYAVADGMGGPGIGDLAAETALAILEQHRQRVIAARERFNFVLFARDYVDHANSVICQLLEHCQGLPVGTTLAALIIEGDTAYTINIGNSRIYLYRDDHLYCLTQDHIEQTAERRRMTRYLGMPDKDELAGSENLTRTVIQRGDQFLLATDGMTDLLDDSTLAAVLATPTAFVQQIRQLQSMALQAGAPDNLALIGIRVLDPSTGKDADGRGGRSSRSRTGQSAAVHGRSQDMLQQDLQERRWLKPLLYYLIFVLLGLVLGKVIFAISAWLTLLLAVS